MGDTNWAARAIHLIPQLHHTNPKREQGSTGSDKPIAIGQLFWPRIYEICPNIFKPLTI
jgi:hypothetical protein